MAILGVYVIVIGPICYLILKKRDKREKGWIAIPVIAVVFSGIIFGISSTSYQKDPLVSFMSFTDLDQESVSTQISVGIRTPEKNTVSLRINDDLLFSNMMNYYYRYGYNNQKCYYTIKEEDAYTEIKYYDQNSWQSNSFVTTADNV